MSGLEEEFDRELIEWDWVKLINRGSVLHAVRLDISKTECGLSIDDAWIPGIMSRIYSPRCQRCCTKTGMPQGIGSPKNDKDNCGKIVLNRLSKLE